MKPALRLAGALLLTCFGLSAPAFATEYPLPPPDSRLIGENVLTQVPDNKQPLEAIAARYQVGLLSMLEANPGTDPWLPKAGTQLTVPLQMILPDTPREGIVVNLAELRLYYYPKGEDKVIVYPIGIGQLGAATPVMVTQISQKIPNPTWTPTANIRKRYAKEGITLPGVVPAGPDNPMGQFAMRLARGTGQYLHGQPEGEVKYFYEDGRPWATQNYLKGERHGTWTEWTQDDAPPVVHHYKNGVPID